jgi:hypothetical protein
MINPHQTHRWSGWPGAYCMHCGIDDPLEQCLADHDVAFSSIMCTEHPVPVCRMYDGRDPYTVEVYHATETKHR